MAHTTATMLSSGKGPKLTDFVMRWGKRTRQTAEEQLNIFRALASQKKD